MRRRVDLPGSANLSVGGAAHGERGGRSLHARMDFGYFASWLRSAVVPLLLAAVSGLYGAELGVWKDLPPLPTPRQEVGVAALGRDVYVIGGILVNRRATGTVERFDTDELRWHDVPPLPGGIALHHMGAASAGGRVYAMGGLDNAFNAARSVFAYDPEANDWGRVADLPWPRGAMGAAALDGRIYAAGGQDGGTSFDDFAVYDIAEDRWTKLPEMPTARNHLAAVAVDGAFYAVGGRNGGLHDTLEIYDIARDRWSTLAPLPTARGGIAAAALGGWIYVFGGEGNALDPRGIFPHVEAYDICAGRWTAHADMPHPRHGIGAAVVDGAIYIPGGGPVLGFGVSEVVDAYRPTNPPTDAFLRGDANRDGELDISDPVTILTALFLGTVELECEDAADVTDDGTLDVSDPIALLSFLFQGGTSPPSPGIETAGPDPTDDNLGCGRSDCTGGGC